MTNGIAIGRNISLRGWNDGIHACGIAIGRNISVYGGSSASTNSGVIAIGDRIFGTSDGDYLPSVGEGPVSGIYIGSAFEKNTQNASYGVGAMIGKGLKLKSKYGEADNTNTQAFIVGQYNDTNLPDALFAIGCGTNGNNRKNALSVSNTKFKVLNDLQLNADNTSVNAIVPPTDPNNVTTDEKTLATKAYVDDHTLGITVPRADVLLTGQSTSLVVGQAISLETDLSLTIPSWTKQIRLGIHNSGGYVEYLLVDNISSHSYVSVTGAGTVDVYSYDPATTTFSFVSGGASMSIVSVRAEGTASI